MRKFLSIWLTHLALTGPLASSAFAAQDALPLVQAEITAFGSANGSCSIPPIYNGSTFTFAGFRVDAENHASDDPSQFINGYCGIYFTIQGEAGVQYRVYGMTLRGQANILASSAGSSRGTHIQVGHRPWGAPPQDSFDDYLGFPETHGSFTLDTVARARNWSACGQDQKLSLDLLPYMTDSLDTHPFIQLEEVELHWESQACAAN